MKINFLIDSGFTINMINLATIRNLIKMNSKLNLKATKKNSTLRTVRTLFEN